MSQGIITISYIVAAILFIFSLGGLAHQETARRGNIFGMVGMGIAMLATMFSPAMGGYGLLIPAMAIGAVAGLYVANKVEMTEMPELVAILHSFVGLAATLVGIGSYLDPSNTFTGVSKTIHEVEVYLGVFIGAITFTGSIIAFGKLRGLISGTPLTLPMRHWLNLSAIILCVLLGSWFLGAESHSAGIWPLLIMTLIAFALGVHLVMAIGGADMPVVVSMLNSYSGWAAAATGFMLSNDLLIVTGALVGSSGAILSYIMCRAMNRSFISVILGGFGTGGGAAAEGVEGEIIPTSVEETAQLLNDAKEVIIVPGYGMAVAQAQAAVSEMTKKLRAKGTLASARSTFMCPGKRPATG